MTSEYMEVLNAVDSYLDRKVKRAQENYKGMNMTLDEKLERQRSYRAIRDVRRAFRRYFYTLLEESEKEG